jgi:hypothetical protein
MCLNYGHPRLINLRNWREPLYDQLKSTIFNLIMKKDVHMNFTNREEKWVRSRFGFASNLVLVV